MLDLSGENKKNVYSRTKRTSLFEDKYVALEAGTCEKKASPLNPVPVLIHFLRWLFGFSSIKFLYCALGLENPSQPYLLIILAFLM